MENSRARAALNKNFWRSITRGVLFEKTTPLDPLQKLLIMCSIIFNEKFLRGAGAVFSKSGWHPQPKMPPNRLKRVGTAEKFVFFVSFYKVLVKSAPARRRQTWN